jgi:NNP family nitrate/nitrite transporter-like MFS transporter
MRREGFKGLFSAGHFGTLFSAFLYFDMSFMVWVIIGALGVYIAEDFSLTPMQKGLLVATPLLSGSLLRIPLGVASDLFGPKKTATVGLCLTVVPLILGWIAANGIASIFVIGVMLGIAGASFAVALPMASRAYPAQYQGLVMGIAGAGNSGTVISALLAPRLAEIVGWQGVFGAAIVPILLTLGIFRLAAREQPAARTHHGLASYLSVIKETDAWWFSLFYMVTFGGFVGLASFLGFFFHDQYSVSKVMAGNLTALCVFAGSFARPVGGLLADRFGGIKTLTVLFGIVAMTMLFVAQVPQIAPAVAALLLAMALLGMGNGAVFQLVPQRFRNEIGVVTGVVGAAGGVGGFLLPFILGASKQMSGSYGSGFVMLSLAALTCLGLLVYVQREWRREWARAEVGVSF